MDSLLPSWPRSRPSAHRRTSRWRSMLLHLSLMAAADLIAAQGNTAADLTISSNNTCYFPDSSTIAFADRPCVMNSGHSACCGRNSDGTSALCLEAGMCMVDFKLSRGSCTDKSWNDSACPQRCTDVGRGGGFELASCGIGQLWSCGDCNLSNFTINGHILDGPRLRANAVSVNGTKGSTNNTSGVLDPAYESDGTPGAAAGANLPNGPSATVVGVAVGGSLAAVIVATLYLLFRQRRLTKKLQSQLLDEQKEHWATQHRMEQQQQQHLQRLWANAEGGGGGAAGFGWADSSSSPRIRPSMAELQHQRRGRGPALHPDSKFFEDYTELKGSMSPDTSVRRVHEMEVSPLEMEAPPPVQHPFENKWFTLRRSG